jgi:hypothetical protein
VHPHKVNTRLLQDNNNPHSGHGLAKRTLVLLGAKVVGFAVGNGMAYALEPLHISWTWGIDLEPIALCDHMS